MKESLNVWTEKPNKSNKLDKKAESKKSHMNKEPTDWTAIRDKLQSWHNFFNVVTIDCRAEMNALAVIIEYSQAVNNAHDSRTLELVIIFSIMQYKSNQRSGLTL